MFTRVGPDFSKLFMLQSFVKIKIKIADIDFFRSHLTRRENTIGIQHGHFTTGAACDRPGFFV